MVDKSKYEKIKIPEELSLVVDEAIEEGLKIKEKKYYYYFPKLIYASLAVFIVGFISLLNVSSVFAKTLYEVPIVGEICKILTFREYSFENELEYVKITIPEIVNTGKSDLEIMVNLKIKEVIENLKTENEVRIKEYYDAFIETGGKKEDFIPVGIDINYEIKQISDKYVSFIISQHETRFSAYNYNYYYNIDIEKGHILTLEDLMGQQYREKITNSIEKTINSWSNEKKELLFENLEIEDYITTNTNFYINNENELVIVFDKYQIAAGSMGEVEFVIGKLDDLGID